MLVLIITYIGLYYFIVFFGTTPRLEPQSYLIEESNGQDAQKIRKSHCDQKTLSHHRGLLLIAIGIFHHAKIRV